MGSEQGTNMAKAWRILWAAVIINLLCGFGYAWSLFKAVIRRSIETGGAFDWDLAALNDPFASFNLVFAFSTILTGPFYDRWGPKFTSVFGMICVGSGLIVCGLTANYWAWVFGWGVLTPFGISWTWAAATPTVMKWFPVRKMGMVTGIVVAGAGISPIYIAPLVQYFLKTYGLSQTLYIVGTYSIVIGVLCALYLSDPPSALRTTVKRFANFRQNMAHMLRSYQFRRVWLLFFIGGGVGLMVIGSVAEMAAKSLGEAAFMALALLAVGNALGRIGGGYISDRIGRKKSSDLCDGLSSCPDGRGYLYRGRGKRVRSRAGPPHLPGGLQLRDQHADLSDHLPGPLGGGKLRAELRDGLYGLGGRRLFHGPPVPDPVQVHGLLRYLLYHRGRPADCRIVRGHCHTPLL
ncbi:MAG: MFS transporter [Desulfobacteraceae bacterium]